MTHEIVKEGRKNMVKLKKDRPSSTIPNLMCTVFSNHLIKKIERKISNQIPPQKVKLQMTPFPTLSYYAYLAI